MFTGQLAQGTFASKRFRCDALANGSPPQVVGVRWQRMVNGGEDIGRFPRTYVELHRLRPTQTPSSATLLTYDPDRSGTPDDGADFYVWDYELE